MAGLDALSPFASTVVAPDDGSGGGDDSNATQNAAPTTPPYVGSSTAGGSATPYGGSALDVLKQVMNPNAAADAYSAGALTPGRFSDSMRGALTEMNAAKTKAEELKLQYIPVVEAAIVSQQQRQLQLQVAQRQQDISLHRGAISALTPLLSPGGRLDNDSLMRAAAAGIQGGSTDVPHMRSVIQSLPDDENERATFIKQQALGVTNPDFYAVPHKPTVLKPGETAFSDNGIPLFGGGPGAPGNTPGAPSGAPGANGAPGNGTSITIPNWQIHQVNVGDRMLTVREDPISGQRQIVGNDPINESADTRAHVAADIRGQNMTAGTAAAGQNIEAVKADPYGLLGLNKNVSPTTGAINSGLTGDAFLATLPPAVAAQVKMMATGRIPITAMSTRSPQNQYLLGLATQYEPGTDATTYIQRAQTIKDFAPGGKDGQAITNANTALHHAGQLADAIDKLDNSDTLPGLVNPVANFVAQKGLGSSAQGNYKMTADALSSEVRKLYAGASGGSLSELQSWQDSFDKNAGKSQQKAYLQKGMELLTGAIQSKQDAYQRGMGSRANFGTLLSPASQAVLSRLAPDYAATLGIQSPTAAATPGGANSPTAPRVLGLHNADGSISPLPQ